MPGPTKGSRTSIRFVYLGISGIPAIAWDSGRDRDEEHGCTLSTRMNRVDTGVPGRQFRRRQSRHRRGRRQGATRTSGDLEHELLPGTKTQTGRPDTEIDRDRLTGADRLVMIMRQMGRERR